MNKIDIIFIYLIIIISFACIIKIYLNNKKIDRFYSIREFNGVMKFVDENTKKYLGSFPNMYDECFRNAEGKPTGSCMINDRSLTYDSNTQEIRLDSIRDNNPDKVIKVSLIELPKGDKGDNGIRAKQPTINFYYRNEARDIVNEDGSLGEDPFHTVQGDCNQDEDCPEDITVNVNKFDCTCEDCKACEGNVKINSITSINADPEDDGVGNAIQVNGNINTNKIILEDGGKICINEVDDDTDTDNCLDYNDISLLLQWKNEACLRDCIIEHQPTAS